MKRNAELEDIVFRLEMLTETFVALRDAVEYSKNELPKNFIHMPVEELKKISEELFEQIEKIYN